MALKARIIIFGHQMWLVTGRVTVNEISQLWLTVFCINNTFFMKDFFTSKEREDAGRGVLSLDSITIPCSQW